MGSRLSVSAWLQGLMEFGEGPKEHLHCMDIPEMELS